MVMVMSTRSDILGVCIGCISTEKYKHCRVSRLQVEDRRCCNTIKLEETWSTTERAASAWHNVGI